MKTVVSVEQSSNASPPMNTHASGMVMDCSDVHEANAMYPIVSSWLDGPKDTVDRDRLWSNALPPMVVTVSGKETDVNGLPWKLLAPMAVTSTPPRVAGIEMSASVPVYPVTSAWVPLSIRS